MKIVIPVKSNSERVKNKNFRPFFKNYSLTDLLIEKLSKIASSKDIYVSCDDPGRKDQIEDWGANFVLRKKELVSNDTPMSKVICEVVKLIPGNDPIMWCLVTDPLFDSYEQCLKTWRKIDQTQHDSLVVVYPQKSYVLDPQYQPINFGMGIHHVPTQYIKPVYVLNNTLFIVRRDALFQYQYYIGKHPYWYEANNLSVDIDTEDEFKMAQVIYSATHKIG